PRGRRGPRARTGCRDARPDPGPDGSRAGGAAVRLPERGAGQTRIGVAVRVPEPFATVLAEARRRSGDPFADVIPPHVTLLGPTVVDVARLDEVHAHLADVAAHAAPFDMILR